MKIAIVFDDLIQHGGAENLLVAVAGIWPDSKIYTTCATKEWLAFFKKRGTTVKTSFLQYLPFKKYFYRFFGPFLLYNLAIESFDFSDYDIVFSMSTRYAHGVITKPSTKHVCYMNSPGRMFWEPFSYFDKGNTFLLKLLALPLNVFRLWDFSVSQRVDYFLANSLTPQRRIAQYYNRESTVIYPFVEIPDVECSVAEPPEIDYFLVVSRLVSWKKIEIAVRACEALNLNLIVVGEGPARKHLENVSNGSTRFEGYVSSQRKAYLYRNCLALINTQYEDFGLTPLEAMSYGKPVLAFAKGGATETVVPSVTGEFFYEQTPESLQNLLKSFDPLRYNASTCKEHAMRYSKSVFVQRISSFVNNIGGADAI